MITIPNSNSGANAELVAQAAPDTVDFEILALALNGQGVVTGCAVSPQSPTPNNQVLVAAGVVTVAGVAFPVSASSGLGPVTNNSSGNPRWDLVIYRVGTGLMILAGTPGPAPFTPFPAITPATDVVLASLYVATSGSAPVITGTEIVDKRAAATLPQSIYDPAEILQQVVGISATQELSNKRIDARVLTLPAPATNPAIDTDNVSDVQITGLTGALALGAAFTGTPKNNDRLHISITDNGTSQSLAFNITLFESCPGGVELPTATVAGVRMDFAFIYNTETSRWRIVGSTPGSPVVQQDLGSTPVSLTTTPATVFNPSLGVGVYFVIATMVVTAASAAGIKVAAAMGPTVGGTATFTVLTGGPGSGGGGTGNNVGSFFKAGTTAGSQGDVITLIACVVVSAAGTVNIQAATSSGTASVSSADTTITPSAGGHQAQVSQVLCFKMG